MNRKEYGCEVPWPNLRSYPENCLGGRRKTIKKRAHDSLPLGQDLNPGLPEHKAAVLPTLLLCSIEEDGE
jgi:hypothetical protein